MNSSASSSAPSSFSPCTRISHQRSWLMLRSSLASTIRFSRDHIKRASQRSHLAVHDSVSSFLLLTANALQRQRHLIVRAFHISLRLLSPFMPIFYIFVFLAGGISVLSIWFISFDFQPVEHKGTSRRFTTYDTMTLRCYLRARTYTYTLSWSDICNCFGAGRSNCPCLHCFQHLFYLLGGHRRSNNGRKEIRFFPIHFTSIE